jgi:hypothetical protein
MENLKLTELKKTIVVQATTIGLDTTFYEDLDIQDPKKDTKNIIEIMERCISQEIDPWKVDVVSFAMIVKELTSSNLMSISEAGYIIFRSWGIVHVQALDLIETFKKKEETDLDDEMEISDPILDGTDNLTDFEDEEFISIKIPVTHHEIRKVMLVELIDVMRQTERMREKIARIPENSKILDVEQIFTVLNSGEPEKELEVVENKIKSIVEHGFYMEDQWGLTKEERIKFFIYSMFLGKRGLIEMKQEVPYDRIWVEKDTGQ